MDEISVRILLVEDSPTDADLLRQVFLHSDKEGWELLHVERLEYGIEICQQQSFDVVLLDLRLPDSDGFETVAEFRVAVPDIPIIVLTMMDDEELALQAMAGGAQDYLVKDQITMQLLIRSIRYAIERGRILQRLKNSEQSILRSLEQEQELNLLRSSFISMASHELRTPLTMIRTCVELLQNFNHELAEERRNQYFDRIKMAISQITHLLDDVLVLGSTKSGGLVFKPEPLDLEEFCRELAESIQFSNSNQHRIVVTCQGSCVGAEMDTALLRHIFSNLLSNAIKYSPQGCNVQFDLICEDGYATFQIKDQGIGIPLKDQGHLFETFYRCSNVGKIPGTGLGLAIVKKCVELHRGRIRLNSKAQSGTTFTVKLPLKP
ncbi:hybrid sensor histidine kinase/response regulator [Kovacikia minuta CCNUW1]|uniref:hybrid sensor histidine kinase/response regulator n=1 Tax=Kovacikia minuta TaxID=2931930 RepID=UPI001CCD6187|nr:hybrid sensor histidine kinase/response regulator [Kovacikia minuta]UBF28183.1 hybrid sensor histidine kinase/response regulator [Kovacikia minuta CCNUW1]